MLTIGQSRSEIPRPSVAPHLSSLEIDDAVGMATLVTGWRTPPISSTKQTVAAMAFDHLGALCRSFLILVCHVHFYVDDLTSEVDLREYRTLPAAKGVETTWSTVLVSSAHFC